MNVIDLVSQNSNLLSGNKVCKKIIGINLGLSATTKAIVMASAFDSIEKAVLITSVITKQNDCGDFIYLEKRKSIHFWEMIIL